MKNADESIEKVLAGLRTAGPTPGIERRILNTLEAMKAHNSAHVELGWRRLLPLWLVTPRPVATISLAVVVGMAGLIFIFNTTHHFGHTPTHSGSEMTKTATAGRSLLAASGADQKPDKPAGPAVSQYFPEPSDNQLGHGFSHDALWPPSSRTLASEVNPSSAERSSPANESQPLDAAYTPSFPAPPMALTEQERLLLQVAHRHDPANLAILNPVQRQTQIAKDSAQFQEFFAPPPSMSDPALAPVDNPPPQDEQTEDNAAQNPAPTAQPTAKKR